MFKKKQGTDYAAEMVQLESEAVKAITQAWAADAPLTVFKISLLAYLRKAYDLGQASK